MPVQSLTAGLAIVVCALLSGNAWSDSLASFGLRTKDKIPCRLTDGRGFEAPTIVLMTGAYDKLSKDKVPRLKSSIRPSTPVATSTSPMNWAFRP